MQILQPCTRVRAPFRSSRHLLTSHRSAAPCNTTHRPHPLTVRRWDRPGQTWLIPTTLLQRPRRARGGGRGLGLVLLRENINASDPFGAASAHYRSGPLRPVPFFFPSNGRRAQRTNLLDGGRLCQHWAHSLWPAG